MKNELAAYLAGQQLADSTAKNYARNAERFAAWCKAEGIAPRAATYSDVVHYLSTLRLAGRTKQLHLTAIRYLMAWQREHGRRGDNPAEAVELRGLKRRLPHALLAEEQLWHLYRDQPTATAAERRDREMLGLMALQGLQVGEVKKLCLEDLNLERATVAVPSCRRSVPRLMKLEAEQIVPLVRYVESARPQLIEATGQTEALFLSSKGRGPKALQNVLMQLAYRLRDEYSFFERLEQLRASRIALWVEQHGLRKAQHLAGHRHVSSTERYQRATLEALKRSVEQHHPLR
jgi:integrase/recombinase XerD